MLSEREQTLWTALDAIDELVDSSVSSGMDSATALDAIHAILVKREVIHQMVAFHEEWKAEFGEECYPRMYGE